MMFGEQKGRTEVYYTLIATATIMTILEVVAAYVLFFPETRGHRQGDEEDSEERRGPADRAARSAGGPADHQNGSRAGAPQLQGRDQRPLVRLRLRADRRADGAHAGRARALPANEPEGGVRRLPPLRASLLTVACLVPFQALFYYMSKYKWEYRNPFPMLAPIVLRSCAGSPPTRSCSQRPSWASPSPTTTAICCRPPKSWSRGWPRKCAAPKPAAATGQ